MKTNLLINNKSVQGNADTFDVINPFNSEIIASIAQSSSDQVNEAVLDQAKSDVIFLHCLPAVRGQEISSSLLDDPRSRVWQQAENRLHAQKGLLKELLK